VWEESGKSRFGLGGDSTISMAESTASTGTLHLLISSITMDSQDSRFTTPPPYYGNLYDAETPPSTQPRSPLFVPDSQAESSQELFPLRSHVYNPSHVDCTRDKRLQIQIALLFKIPWAQIKERLDVTDSQITYAKHYRLTPQKTRAGRHAKLHTPKKTILKEWLLSSPSHRHVAYHKISHHLPQLHAKEQAIRTAI
jgi:hypothetical protein